MRPTWGSMPAISLTCGRFGVPAHAISLTCGSSPQIRRARTPEFQRPDPAYRAIGATRKRDRYGQTQKSATHKADRHPKWGLSQPNQQTRQLRCGLSQPTPRWGEPGTPENVDFHSQPGKTLSQMWTFAADWARNDEMGRSTWFRRWF